MKTRPPPTLLNPLLGDKKLGSPRSLFIYSEIENLAESQYLAIITGDGEILFDFGDLAHLMQHLEVLRGTLGRRLPEARLPIFEFTVQPKKLAPDGRARVPFRKRLLP